MRYRGDEWNRSQSGSSYQRPPGVKPWAAFELCAPVATSKSRTFLNCRLLAPARTVGVTAGPETQLPSFISSVTARFDLWLIVQEHAQQRAVDFDGAVVADEAEFTEFVHEF